MTLTIILIKLWISDGTKKQNKTEIVTLEDQYGEEKIEEKAAEIYLSIKGKEVYRPQDRHLPTDTS